MLCPLSTLEITPKPSKPSGHSGTKSKRAILSLRKYISILTINEEILDKALNSAITDFEDALQYHAAEAKGVDFIVTRNEKDYRKLWIRGGFPRSFLARSEKVSVKWREDFIRTFLERDIPSLGINIPARMLRRFWMMLSNYHGQIFNSPELGRNELVALDRRVREYYDDKLGDFMDVGFRVCEDLIDTELRRCLFRREYQVMALGYLDYGAMFGDVPIETFAYHFNGPIVLVGPQRPDQFYLNPPATIIRWQLGFAETDWEPVAVPAETGTLQ